MSALTFQKRNEPVPTDTRMGIGLGGFRGADVMLVAYRQPVLSGQQIEVLLPGGHGVDDQLLVVLEDQHHGLE